tara:strand:+ start:58 stop:417 length:360 start_codon:yes stop_codon:yes gene_type:complete
MNFLKKAGLIIWTAIPLLYLASFKQIELDALDRAYAVKECDANHSQIRENYYQESFNEGYDKGFETGVHVAFDRAKAATFDALMGKLDEMGVFDEDIKEKIKEEMEVALSMRSKINRNK